LARTRIETLVILGCKPELAPEQSAMDGVIAIAIMALNSPLANPEIITCQGGSQAAIAHLHLNTLRVRIVRQTRRDRPASAKAGRRPPVKL
jgi:hypothetical protein